MKLAINRETVVDTEMFPRYLLDANPGPVVIVGEDGLIEESIDRSFVVDIPGSSSDEAIAKTIIDGYAQISRLYIEL